MNCQDVKKGMRVRVTRLGKTDGLMIKSEYLAPRAVGAEGEVQNWVAGHGGDVWWVKHDNGQIAAYCFDEFEEIQKPKQTRGYEFI